MPKRILLLLAAVATVGLVGGLLTVWERHVEENRFSLPLGPLASMAKEYAPTWVVAPGFVEPVSKELRLGFDMSGVIAQFMVKEGDMVRKGQPLAMLRQEEYKAALEEASARYAEAKANLAMHLTGARKEEIEKAESALKSATVRLEQAEKELRRREKMIRTGGVGIEDLERAQRDAIIAAADKDIAFYQDKLTNSFYRIEEIEMATQRELASKAAVEHAAATLDKTLLRSPVDGKVLRVYMDPGEAYSIFEPTPILSVGDVSTLNVRAEVDERDVAKVREGQAAFVAADAFGGVKYKGRVSRLELSMTPKKTRTGDPSEPVDRSVLEVLVTLDEPGPFISGMRVDVYIQGDTQEGEASSFAPDARQPFAPGASTPAAPGTSAITAPDASATTAPDASATAVPDAATTAAPKLITPSFAPEAASKPAPGVTPSVSGIVETTPHKLPSGESLPMPSLPAPGASAP